MPFDAGVTPGRPVVLSPAGDRDDGLLALGLVPPPADPPAPSEGLDHDAGERDGRPVSAREATPAQERDWLVPLPDPPVNDDAEDRAAQRPVPIKAAERNTPSIAI